MAVGMALFSVVFWFMRMSMFGSFRMIMKMFPSGFSETDYAGLAASTSITHIPKFDPAKLQIIWICSKLSAYPKNC
jgi:hypothetical protein